MIITIGKTKDDNYYISGSYDDIKNIRDILDRACGRSVFNENFTHLIEFEDRTVILFDGHMALLSAVKNLCEFTEQISKIIRDETDFFERLVSEIGVLKQEVKYLSKAVMYLKKTTLPFCTKEQKRTALASYRRNAEQLRRLAHNNPQIIEKKRSDIYDEL